MSVYKFINKFNDNVIKYVVTSTETCTDIVRHFSYFLMGTSFHSNSIAEAFRDVADEIDPPEELHNESKNNE